MSAPAVPNDQMKNEDSTKALPPEPLSEIRSSTVDPTPEIESHMGAPTQNQIPTTLFLQWMQLAFFTWNTAQIQGTVLYSVPIHPQFMSEWIQYYTKFWYAWRGGLMFRMKVAGTGFHAGCIALVRIPPGMKVQDVSNRYTIFEWDITDPKQLATEGFEIFDQVNLMYHRMEYDPNNYQTYGGTLAIIVQMPLVTSSTGVNEIGVNLWCRLGQDFRVSQMLPITLAGNTINFNLILNKALDFKWPTLNDFDHFVVSTLNINTVNKTMQKYNYGMVKIDGTNLNTEYVPWFDNGAATLTTSGSVTGQWSFIGITGTGIQNFNDRAISFQNGTAAAGTAGVTFGNNNTTNVPVADTTSSRFGQENITATPWIHPSNFTTAWRPYQVGIGLDGQGRVLSATACSVKNQLTNGELFVPFNNETILLFATTAQTGFVYTVGSSTTQIMYGCQTRQISELLQMSKLVNQPGDALLFQLIHRATDLPIMYVKLYPEGYFTVASSIGNTNLIYADYRLEYQNTISVTATIPTNSEREHIMNRLMLKVGKKIKRDRLLETEAQKFGLHYDEDDFIEKYKIQKEVLNQMKFAEFIKEEQDFVDQLPHLSIADHDLLKSNE
jgi:hypothetical protein